MSILKRNKMSKYPNPICFDCKHFRGPLKKGCDAFPDKIPDEITFTNKHSKPIKGQQNDIVFEPKDK